MMTEPGVASVEPANDEHPAGASQVSASEPAGALSVYFRDMSRTEVMSREQESALANRIVEQRRSLWRAALNYPPLAASICELARGVLPAVDCPTAALDAMIVAARKLRDRDLRIHCEEYARARETLAHALAEADLDNLVADRILADLASIEAGEHHGLSMKIKSPPRGSLPFLTFVHGVRGTYQAFWAARAEFVRANLRLVVTIVRRYRRGRLTLPDLIQEGNLGLIKAVNRFDPRKGRRFSTSGACWIRHAVTQAIADKGRTVRLPVHMVDTFGKVLRARRKFEAQHGPSASDAELAQACQLTPEQFARVRFSLMDAPVSFDQPLAGTRDLTLLDVMADNSTPPIPEAMDHKLLLDNLLELFDKLPPRDADILRKRMGMGGEAEMTLKEIGRHYGLTAERVRQLQEQALAKLRAEFDRRGLM